MMFTRQRLVAFLFPLLLAAPFLNRAYFVDDSYFVEIATWLKDHPTLPYHFHADDAGPQTRGWEENGFVRMVNPLAHHYFLALLLKIGGEREWFLRLGCVLLACFSGLFLFELARRWTYHPLLATLLTLATPVHWLTSYSLLIDGTAGFFFFGALYFFIRGTENDSVGWFLASGIFMGLATISKYPALMIVPLTMVWSVLRWKKLTRPWLVFIPWLIGVLFLVGYSAWTAHLYGRPHILAASDRMVRVYGWAKFLVFFVFLSGATLVPLAAWRWMGKRLALFFGFVVFVLTIFFSSAYGGFTETQGFLVALWSVTSLVFIWAHVRHWRRWVYPTDHFLFLWLLGFIVMMFVVMGWVAARYYVIVVPAVVFLVVRIIEAEGIEQAGRRIQVILVLTLLFTGALAYADYKQAD